MSIDASVVVKLREMTGAGMMDAKKALVETNGDLEQAAEYLRKKGIAKAGNKADRATNEGLVYAYIHASGKLGAMVEIVCETDFVARTDNFKELCKDVAMHISATDPLYVKRESVPEEIVQKQKMMFAEEVAAQAKSPEITEKIVSGKMDKWFSEVVLMEQAFIKDEDKTIEEVVKEKISTIGENIQVTRFSRFLIG